MSLCGVCCPWNDVVLAELNGKRETTHTETGTLTERKNKLDGGLCHYFSSKLGEEMQMTLWGFSPRPNKAVNLNRS